MAFFIHPNQCVLFFSDPSTAFTPERMKQVLAEDRITAEGDKEPFVLQWGDGPKFYASIVRGEAARLLAERLMGPRGKYRALAAASDAYIQMMFESLEDVLDDINTLIILQSVLQAATNGLFYRSWNQTFSGPEE